MRLLRGLCAIAICVFVSGLSMAQASLGSIRIDVKDPSGAAVEASGKIKSLDSGAEQPFHTDSQGRHKFDRLPFGHYRIDISKSGFAAQSVNIELSPDAAAGDTVITLAIEKTAYKVDVVATTPLEVNGVPIEQVAAPVQIANSQDMEKSGALDLSDLLNLRLNGVHVNNNQENPFQTDINYRGYTASPLLGTPEGISVYMDGVRQNQPFGDVVAWDLMPKIAMEEVTLMPGSDPLYGLNTLGGAISIRTKDGITNPGTSVELSGGSFGRRAGEFEHGGSNSKGWSWYLAGNLFREEGWRVDSPSEVRQTFSKIGWTQGRTSIALSFAYADNWLTGNGLQDFRFLQQHYSSVYTVPDITWNRSPGLNLTLRRVLTSKLSISGNGYFRHIRADTTNGDINENSFDESLYNLSAADIAALTAAGYKGFPTTGNATTEPFPYWRCIAQGLEKSEPIEKCTGIITNTFARQNNYGFAGQITHVIARNRITAGAAWDRSSIRFQQYSQFGYLDPDRLTITPIHAFADGSTTQDDVPVDTRVDLRGRINTFSLYATDTVALGKSLHLTFSGRYNRTRITNTDLLPPDPEARGSLDGRYVFGRFNPAVGLTYSPVSLLNFYVSYSESSRAPTAIELGCADPNQPCNLPNALVSDPPLKQVVSRTVEAGVRGGGESGLRWSAGWFRGVNHDDLLFVASEQTGFGYFTNFGETQRQGAEANLSGRIRSLTLGGGYTFVSATYQSQQVVDGGSNSSNDAGSPGMDGDIQILPGERIPEIPRHMLKAWADWQPFPRLTVDLDFVALSRSYARGNENNQDVPDGVYYLGPGTSPGYGVLNAGAKYRIQKRVEAYVQVDNVLNHRYYTAAQLGPSPYDNNGSFIARPFAAANGDFPIRTSTFFAPGAPIGAWGGLRFRF